MIINAKRISQKGWVIPWEVAGRFILNLSRQTQSLIIGTLLGDAYLYPNGTLQIEHQFKHAGYTFWKYEKLQSIAGKPPIVIERYDVRTNKTYRSMRFYTKAVLKNFRNDFYCGRKKIIPNNIADLIDPFAMAVWFMDDGGRGARTPRGLVINASSYNKQEREKLQLVLAEKFGLNTSIRKTGNGFQIYIKAESFNIFVKLVSPYIIPEMQYKLPVDLVTTSPQ